MSEENTTTTTTAENTVSTEVTPDAATEGEKEVNYNSPEYIDSVIKDFSGVLGFGEKQESASEESTKTEETSTGEQAGDKATEQAKAAPEEQEPTRTPAEDQSQVIAQKAEAEAKAREEAKVTEKAQTQAITEARAQAVKEVQTAIRINPQRWLEDNAEGIGDIGEFAMHAYRVALGDQAPPELVKRTSSRGSESIMGEVERKFEMLRAENAEALKNVELKATAAGYDAYVKNLPEIDDNKHFKAALENDAEGTRSRLFNIADTMAGVSEGKYPNAEQVVTEYVRQVEEIIKLHNLVPSTEQSAQPSTPTEQPEPKETKITLTNDLADLSSTASAQAPLQGDELVEDALKWMEESNFKI